MVRWLRWHCPPDTGFEIRTLAVWGRARYLSVTEAPRNTDFHTWMGEKRFVYFKPPRPGTEPRTPAWKAGVLTTTLGPLPCGLKAHSTFIVGYCANHGTVLALAGDWSAAVTLLLGLEGLEPMLEQHWLVVHWWCELIGKVFICFRTQRCDWPWTEPPALCEGAALETSLVQEMKWNESGFRPPMCTYRLNWARRTSWGWCDDGDDTVLQTQDSKFEPWRSGAEHATSRSRRLPTILTFTRGWGRNIFVSFKPPRPGTEPQTLAWKAAVLTTTLGPPSRSRNSKGESWRVNHWMNVALHCMNVKHNDYDNTLTNFARI